MKRSYRLIEKLFSIRRTEETAAPAAPAAADDGGTEDDSFSYNRVVKALTDNSVVLRNENKELKKRVSLELSCERAFAAGTSLRVYKEKVNLTDLERSSCSLCWHCKNMRRLILYVQIIIKYCYYWSR